MPGPKININAITKARKIRVIERTFGILKIPFLFTI
jgi:hypothetical protein